MRSKTFCQTIYFVMLLAGVLGSILLLTDLAARTDKTTSQAKSETTPNPNTKSNEQVPLENIFAGRLLRAGDDPDACVEVAKWARVNKLGREYVLALRRALQVDRNHGEAGKLLRDCRQRYVYMPYNAKARAKMRYDMGGAYAVTGTDHYRICYNSSDLFAEICGDLLEKVYWDFMKFFKDRGLEPAPITDRLEVVLFEDRDQFRRYASKIRGGLPESAGFFLSETDRSYFYDSNNNPNFEESMRRINEAQEKLNQTRQQVKQNRKGRTRWIVTDPDGTQRELKNNEMFEEMDEQKDYLDTELARLREDYRNLNISITVHEATHQLAYSCGIHSRYYDNPRWLVEGLALYFEAPEEGDWFGPGQIHPKRLEVFTKKEQDGKMISLPKLITDDKVFDLRGSQADSAYAGAWALFYYLSQHRHEALFDYIFEISLRMSDQPYSREKRIEDFEKFFGNIKTLQRHWHGFMAQMTY